ncbi:MAG: bifunctional phosphoglucose/phosphomannose isomerase [Anaerolineales bacterium]|nr:bifunctional phosphoglucose/phosphomannose isomerase [Anaerolineales bacterium]
MNLDDYTTFAQIDTQNMLAQIDGLPAQLHQAWELGQQHPLPAWDGIRQVLVAGMGGSAIGADLLAAYLASKCPIPVVVHRDYGLPAWAEGAHTLVIASSHSGNTEETLSAFDAALENRCKILAVATGGRLAESALKSSVPLWTFEHKGQPRAAVGFSFGLLLAAFSRLNLLPDPQEELMAAIAAMKDQQTSLTADVPVARNLAKRLAGQLVGRWVAVFGAGLLAPVSRRWKGQISELAKSWAQFEFLPEADHNTLAGVSYPGDLLEHSIALFLRSASDHPRNRLRLELTRKTLMLEGLNTDMIDAQGNTPLENLWTCLQLGDYVAYYLAMAYSADPTPIPAIESFKREMLAAG